MGFTRHGNRIFNRCQLFFRCWTAVVGLGSAALVWSNQARNGKRSPESGEYCFLVFRLLVYQKDSWEQQVQISVANKIPFIATNGGHGPKVGQGQFTGINVNLASFNTVNIDTANNL